MRLLRSEKFLAIGEFVASATHLQTLVDRGDKTEHLLKPEDLNAKDKMNYASAERLCGPQLFMLLDEVPGSSYIYNLFCDFHYIIAIIRFRCHTILFTLDVLFGIEFSR